MKSFSQFSAEAYSLPRALGNGLHGNLRYGGPTFNPGLPKPAAKKPDKPTKALSDYQAEILKTVKAQQDDVGVSLDRLVGIGGASRARTKNTLETLVLRGDLFKRTHKQAGVEVSRYFSHS